MVGSMSRISKTAIILGALFVLYVLIGFLIAPPLVRYFGERFLQENFSPESTIERVRINPFKASIRVEGLFLSDPAGSWSMAWKEAEVNASAATLINFYPVVDAVRLNGADIRYHRQPGEVESVDLSETASGPTWREQVEQLNLAEIPQVRVDLLEVSEGRFEFTDTTAAEDYSETIDPINFALRDLTTASDVDGDTAMRFVAETKGDGRLVWEGDFQSHPIRSSGSFSLNGIAVHDLSPYFTELIRFDLERALYALSFDYSLDLSDFENLFQIEAGQMALTEVLCRPIGETDRLIAVESVGIDGIDFRFPSMALKIAEISVRDGETRITRDVDGRINLADLVVLPEAPEDGSATSEPEPMKTEDALPGLSYEVATITLADYRIVWEDRLSAGPANLTVDIPQMQLVGFSSDFASPVEIDASYLLGDTGTASLSGSAVPAGPNLDLALQINSLPLQLLSAYTEAFGDASIHGGTFDFEGRLQYAEAGAQALTGEASVAGFSLVYDDRLDADWSLLELQGMRVDLAPFSLAMDSISLQEPVLVFTQTADEISEPTGESDALVESTGDALVESASDAPAESAGGQSGVPVQIASLRVSDGQFSFNDARMEPATKIVMNETNLDLAGLDLAGDQPAEISFNTRINGSPLTIDGTLDASRLKAATHLKISLKGLALSAFSPYSGQAVGRGIADGQFNLDSDWQIEASQLSATNAIRIENFKLGDRVESEGATRLPLDLAITLLKGPGGVMDLSLPLSGDLSDPKVGIGQIVRTAFVGLITNVASAPFKILGGLVGGGEPEELSFVRFEAGSSELGGDMIGRLNKLATALKKRPDIVLSMQPEISNEDLVRLSEEKLRLELMEGAEVDEERIYRRRLTQRYREQMQAAGTPDRETSAEDAAGFSEMVATLLPGVTLTDADRSALASARTAVIRDHLVGNQEIAAERVVADEPQIGTDASRVAFELR